jgi:hypothetical protein
MATLQVSTRSVAKDTDSSSENPKLSAEQLKLEFARVALTLCEIELWCEAFLENAAHHGPEAETAALRSPEYKQATARYDEAVKIGYKIFRALAKGQLYSDELAIELAMRSALAARKLKARPYYAPKPVAMTPQLVRIPTPKTNVTSFGDLSQRLRVALHTMIAARLFTGAAIARKSGFKQAHISNFLNKRRNGSVEGLDKMMQAAGLTISELL